MKLRLLLLAVFLCFYGQVFSETFVVTSNADAGVGTLREALTKAAANGIAEKDYIHFNLPGNTEADRTITINDLLPAVSSNIEIDGTTQPGLNFGVSDAKVKIIVAIPGNNPELFLVEKQVNVAFFGLSFDKQAGIPGNGYAIQCLSSKNVTIGAAGKGNIFGALYLSVNQRHGVPRADIAYLCENITISANIIGLKEDGETLNRSGVNIGPARNLTFGGNNPADGNVINGAFSYDDYVETELKTGRLLFAHNKVGVNFSGSKVLSVAVNLNHVGLFGPMLESLEFNYNQICGQGVVGISTLSAPFKVIGNKFGTDITGTSVLGMDYNCLLIGYCTGGGIIGGHSPTDQNIFSGMYSLGASHGLNGVVLNIGSPRIELVNNVFRCNNYPRPYNLAVSNTVMSTTQINITSRNENEIRGTASPGARVDLYYSLSCTFCEPEQLFASVYADLNGNWTLTQPLQHLNIIGAATLNGQTSEFTSIRFDYQPFDIKIEMACDDLKGSIKGIKFLNATNYGWYTVEGDLISNTIDLIDASPGKYQFKISDEYCSLSSEVYEIKHIQLQTELANMQVQPASCNARDGKITGIVSNGTSYNWLDNRSMIRSYSLDLIGVEAGTYMLKVVKGNCSKIFGPFIIPNVNGLLIDESAMQTINASCNEANGSVVNLNVAGGSGAVNYVWRNSRGEIVGRSLNLTNVPEDSYILEVKDNSGCAAVYSSAIRVLGTSGIFIDKTAILIDKATCNTSNGRITGITTTGATDYKWLDAGGTTVGTTLHLTGMPAGKYRLVASNAVCSKTSEEIIIALAQTTLNYSTTKIITPASCGLSNGKIEAVFTNDQPAACFWKNSAGIVVGHSRILTNQPPGGYDLYITDDLGCERFAIQYAIGNVAGATINRGLEQVSKDQCGLGKGRIRAPGLSGGQQPYFYQWKDQNGNVIGSTAVIDGLKAGDYQLTIGDALDCSRQTIAYTVENESSTLPVPVVNDVKICSRGNAQIQVLQPQSGTYVLYGANGNAISQNTSGTFNVTVNESQSFSVVLRNGSCESPAASAKVTIENDGLGELANAFSPNGDGQNDHWTIPGMQNYPEATVAIYNRYGHKVFESIGYQTPFNGRLDGTELPVGVYYYIIDLKRGCGLQKGSLTLIK